MSQFLTFDSRRCKGLSHRVDQNKLGKRFLNVNKIPINRCLTFNLTRIELLDRFKFIYAWIIQEFMAQLVKSLTPIVKDSQFESDPSIFLIIFFTYFDKRHWIPHHLILKDYTKIKFRIKRSKNRIT